MKRTRWVFFWLSGIVLILALLPSGHNHPGQAGSAAPSQYRNFLLVTIDTLRADHVSSYGYENKITPNLDRLAKKSFQFLQTFSQIPLTGPGHACILTSRYAHQHGAVRNGLKINDSVKTMAELFREQSFTTAAFISGWTLKSHLTDLQRGFDVYDEFMTDRYRMVNSQRFADQVTTDALAWLELNSEKPFFLWVHYFDPHWPYNENKTFSTVAIPSRAEQDNQYAKKIYGYNCEIAFTDHHFGRLTTKLHQLGLSASTVIMVTSDHGESFGEQNYLGHGRRIYNSGLIVPLFIYLPDRVPASRVLTYPAQHVDLLPTVADLFNLNLAAITPMGESLLPVLAEQQDERTGAGKLIYFETYPGAAKFFPKLFKRKLPKKPSLAGYRTGNQKYIYKVGTHWVELYDLEYDPEELMMKRLPSKEKSLVIDFLDSRIGAGAVVDQDPKLSDEDLEILNELGYLD